MEKQNQKGNQPSQDKQQKGTQQAGGSQRNQQQRTKKEELPTAGKSKKNPSENTDEATGSRE